jgi:hypothetical protein
MEGFVLGIRGIRRCCKGLAGSCLCDGMGVIWYILLVRGLWPFCGIY